MSVTRARIVGAAGSVLLAGSGFAAGALPIDPPSWFGDWRAYTLPALLFGYLGLGLMLAAWWWMRDRADLVTFGIWCLPLAVAPPMFSRDVYSYLAQGAMVSASLDVYSDGVSRLGGRLAAQVAPMWQDTPTPYGPVFVVICALVAGVAGTKLTVGVIGMRLAALAGVGLLAYFVPRLAARCGADPRSALWLGVLNPLVPLHLVAGAHNDALMLGLLVTGLYLAFGQSPRHRFVVATVLVTLAALIKAPAAAALLVVAARWRSVWRVGAVAALVTVSVTFLAGTGYGWISSLSTPIYKHSWSLSSALGRLTRPLLGEASMPFWLWCGLAALMSVTLIVLWRHQRLGVVYALGLGLLALALLGPVTRPWYALWGLIPIAASAPSAAVRRWCALFSGVLALLVLPSGFGPNDPLEVALAAAGVGLAALTLFAFHRPDPVGPPGPHNPQPSGEVAPLGR
ncbi:MAG TPA: polyprenol phosphomannose-dependent alpha 1,6 mannosyltransferase MptB [Candidatus Limnocylindrales bacterium]|nr:polyprenol phosphomannose-dependent alpha 1,6 mannosyltransferase MptB [Candidatus Limnocylindrales bacterium]